MTKHTPGPWRYVDGYFDCEVWAGNKMVLSYQRHPSDEDRANARLMAAAPELLTALEGLTLILAKAESNASGNPEFENVSARVNAARAAIASATEAV